MPPPPSPISRKTYRQAAQVLGRAFVHEPVSVVIYRAFSPEKRARALAVDFAAELRVCMRKGYPLQVEENGQVAAAALIYPPGTYPLPLVYQWSFLLTSVISNGWYDVRSWIKWLDEVDKHHPAKAHYYLEYIGVEPALQGRGYGSLIMSDLIVRADLDGVGCYLENASRLNLPFYQHFGFQIIEEQQIIGFPTWFMWREPG